MLAKYLAAFVAGAIAVLAFAPFEIWSLSIVSLAILFYLCWSCSPKQSGLIGFCFGLGLFLCGVSWVYVSLSTYGGMPLWMGSIAVLGFTSLLSAFVAFNQWLSARLFKANSVQRLLGFTLLWPILEWCKSWVLTGFPWLDFGYTVVDTWLSGWAPLGGVYLVSFVIAVLAMLVVLFVRKPALAVLMVAIIAFGSWALDDLSWSVPSGDKLRVGIVQANVPINEKWQAQNRARVLQDYQSYLSTLNTRTPLDLAVLPETALPVYMQRTDSRFWEQLKPDGVTLLAGVLDSPSLAQGSYEESYNAAVLSCQESVQVYRKRHLVPFGEYLPLRFLFNWVLEYLELPMSDFSAWEGVQKLDCGNGINLGLSICYEDAFADEYRASSGQATLLVNISEDAWFGDSFAPHQRQQMAQMRARELSRPIVRSANSGPSTFINERGAILLETPQFEVALAQQDIQPQTGETLYKRFGSWIVYLNGLILIILGLKRRN